MTKTSVFFDDTKMRSLKISWATIIYMAVSKKLGLYSKMDGENNGKNPMNKWMIWGEKPPIFEEMAHRFFFSLRPWCQGRRQRKLPWQRREDVWLSDHSDWMNDLEG